MREYFCSIACATNDELLKMYKNESYSKYYKSCILDEIARRGILDKLLKD